MPSRTSRLNLRISDELLAMLEEIRERKGLKTVSDVAREALDSYADDEADSWNSEIVKVRVPHNTRDDIESLVMAGDVNDLSQAINFALNDWISARRQYILEGRDAFKKKVDELLEERGAKEKMKSAAQEMSRR